MDPAIFTVYIAQKRYGAQIGAQASFLSKIIVIAHIRKQRIYSKLSLHQNVRSLLRPLPFLG